MTDQPLLAGIWGSSFFVHAAGGKFQRRHAATPLFTALIARAWLGGS